MPTNISGTTGVDKHQDASVVQADIAAGALLDNKGGGVGYSTGSGGTVTQLTSKTTGVTINKLCGQIVMNNSVLNASSNCVFRVNNSLVTPQDVVIITPSNMASEAYELHVTFVSAGLFDIRVTNYSLSNLSETLVINFAVIKGVTA